MGIGPRIASWPALRQLLGGRSDIAFLGGVVNHILQNGRAFQ